jgi:hypothetical protein
MFGGQNENSDDLETVIDKEDNVFVMSNRKTKYPTLQLDLRLIKDLVVIIVSATAGGIIFSCLGQPVSGFEMLNTLLLKMFTSVICKHDLLFSRLLLAIYWPVLSLDLEA